MNPFYKKEVAPMKNHVKIPLVDNDFAVLSKMALNLDNESNSVLMKFFNDVREEPAIGQTAVVEVEGAGGEPISLTVSSFPISV